MINEFTSETNFVVTEHNNGNIAYCQTIDDARYEALEFQKSAPRNNDAPNYTIHTRQEWLAILAENEGDEQ